MPSRYHDLISVGKKGSHYALGTILKGSLALISLPILTRYLEPKDYGLVLLSGVIAAAVQPLYRLGQSGSLYRFFYEYKGRQLQTFVATILSMSSSLGLIITAGLLLFGAPLFERIAPGVPMYPHLALALATGFLAMFLVFPMRLLQVRERSKLFASLSFALALLGLGITLFFVVVLGRGAVGVLEAGLVAAIVSLAPFVYLVRKDICFGFNWRMARQSLRYGLPLVPHMLSGFIITQTDRVFIGVYRSLAHVGLYSVGAALARAVQLLATGANFAWTPFFYRTAKERGREAGKFLGQMATYYLLAIWSLALTVAIFSNEVVHVFATKRYENAALVVSPLLLSVCLSALYYRFVNSLFYAQRTELVTVATFTSAGVNLALNFFLVPAYGMLGAAWSSVAAHAVSCALVYVFGQRAYPLQFEWPRLIRLAVIFPLAYSVSLVLPGSLGFWQSVGLKCAILVAAFLLLFVTGFFSKSEIGRLRQCGAFLKRKVGL